jgi:hypothetical protein
MWFSCYCRHKTTKKVFQIENTKKNKLFVKANNWMVSTFNNAESVIQFSDKEEGLINGCYFMGYSFKSTQMIESAFANIKISVKDGAAKIVVKPTNYKYCQGSPYSILSKEKAFVKISLLIKNFEEFMKKKNEEW